MIYLIGGSPRGGKSILSRKLSKKLNVPYVSTDNLRLVVMPYFKGKEKAKGFPFIKIFDTASTDDFFQKYSGKQQLQADLKEAKSIWPGTKSLINHLLECEMDYIIEGVHLLPNLVKQFKNNKNIRIVFLAKTDEKKIYEGLLKNKNNSDWLIDNIKKEETVALAAKAFLEYGKYIQKEAEKYNFKVFNTEDDFVKKLEEAADYLEK